MVRSAIVALLGLMLGIASSSAQTVTCSGTWPPATLTNGSPASATDVTNNFNYLYNCITAISIPTSTGGAGFANRMRNGTFVSWPNGTSGTIAPSATGSAAIAANGWAVLPATASVTWSQVTAGNNGAPQSLKITGAASVSDVTVGQRIESFDAAALAGKVVTFQMAVYNSTGASITPTLSTRYASSTDTWGSPIADLTTTSLSLCPNNTWTVVTYTFNASANAVNGYEIKVDFGNNFSTTGQYVQISAADLRATPGATTGINTPPAPELATIQAELARNARYFDASYENGTAPATATRVAMYRATSNSGSTQGNSTVKFTVPMRAAPTFSYWDGAGNASKLSLLANTTTTWSDNLTGNPSPWNVSKNAIQVGGSSSAGDYYLHYTAYADFW